MADRGLAGVSAFRVARFLLCAATAFAAAAVATAQASAATISVTKSCYVNSIHRRASMTILGSGFTPGDPVAINSSDGTVSIAITPLLDGTFAQDISAPDPPLSPAERKTVTITALQPTPSGTVTATTQTTIAPLSVVTKPVRAKFTRKVTWMFSGFTPGKQIYAHYLRKRPVAKRRFGKARGACGVLKVRALLFPGGHPRFKTYGVQFDDSKRYHKDAWPRIITKLRARHLR